MITRITSRILAAFVLGIALCIVSHHMDVNRSEMGRSSFLTWQSERFDKFYANPHGPLAPGPLFSGLLLVGAFLGAYELLAFGIYIIIKPKASSEGA